MSATNVGPMSARGSSRGAPCRRGHADSPSMSLVPRARRPRSAYLGPPAGSAALAKDWTPRMASRPSIIRPTTNSATSQAARPQVDSGGLRA